MSNNSHKIGGRMMGGRVIGGRGVGGAIAEIARRHHHGSNAPRPVSIRKRLTFDAILIFLLILAFIF